MGSVERPWGSYTLVGKWSGKITVKVLRISPGGRLSLQRHRRRDEEWLCLEGKARVRVGAKEFGMKAGDRTFVPRNRLHRISSEKGAEFLEVSYGRFSEGDIVRVEDDYGRT
ncbi:MAG: phosphomannose isomerase type II C-terminal cupin domain [Nitrososphaerota archaeon]|nr:phosphomannose isomerase type II C-terminal cupin domain [Nitrososphaerota archaeon]